MTSNKMDSKTTGLNPNDVLMGRGSGANLKHGNIRFRQMVSDKYDEEMSRIECKTMEGIAAVKIKVANDVLQEIKSNGGRFLRKALKPAGANQDGSGKHSNEREVEGYIVYEEISDKEAAEKIKQTLRFQIERRNGYRTGSRRGEDPAELSYLPAFSATAALPGHVPATGNAVLLQSIDDRLLHMISQARISRLLHVADENNVAIGTLPTLNNITTSSFFFQPVNHNLAALNASTWPPLLSAAASAVATTSKRSNSRRSRSHQAWISKHGRAKPSDSAVSTLFQPRPTIPLTPVGYSVTTQTSSCLASPGGSNASATTPACTLESISPSASSQHDMKDLIRREELELMFDRIRTLRLACILRQSMTQPLT
jgi:hypothetical protein